MKALLVIDVQSCYMEKYEDDLLGKINQRIRTAQNEQECIIYVRNTKRLRSGKKTAEFAEGLSVVSEHIFCKEHADAFSNKQLSDLLEQKEVKEVEIIGVDGNFCVAASAAGAKKLGYQVFLRLECIGVQNSFRFFHTKQVLLKKGIFFK